MYDESLMLMEGSVIITVIQRNNYHHNIDGA